MKVVTLVVCLLAIGLYPVFAQQTEAPAPPPTAAELQERLNNAIKASTQKDAELAKLKTALANTPESIDTAVKTRVSDLGKVKEMPIVKACKLAGGKALITTNEKNQLIYAGCLL